MTWDECIQALPNDDQRDTFVSLAQGLGPEIQERWNHFARRFGNKLSKESEDLAEATQGGSFLRAEEIEHKLWLLLWLSWVQGYAEGMDRYGSITE